MYIENKNLLWALIFFSKLQQKSNDIYFVDNSVLVWKWKMNYSVYLKGIRISRSKDRNTLILNNNFYHKIMAICILTFLIFENKTFLKLLYIILKSTTLAWSYFWENLTFSSFRVGAKGTKRNIYRVLWDASAVGRWGWVDRQKYYRFF